VGNAVGNAGDVVEAALADAIKKATAARPGLDRCTV
jgi:hypothetical protein